MTCPAWAMTVSEDVVKAGYVLNFLRYAQLPNQNLDVLTVCLDAPANILEIFKALERKKVNGKRVSVKRLSEDDVASCSAVFFSKLGAKGNQELLQQSVRLGVLTIGDIERFEKVGGMIALFTQDGKVKFRISRKALREADISLSSKVMKLATGLDDEN